MKSERRKIRIDIAFAVLIATLAFVSVSVGCASAATHYVNPGESIQAAVNAADPGDTIIVRDGTYTENVNVNKRLTIKSENGSANCVVPAANPGDHVFEVTADDVTISGLDIYGATNVHRAGIYLYYVSGCTIESNRCGYDSDHKNYHGIWLRSSSNNMLTNNIASNNDNVGIHIYPSSNSNTLTNNTASDNHHGINLCVSSNNMITNNIANENVFCGIGLESSSYNTITSNIANSNIYRGICLHDSSNNKIYLNNFMNNNYNVRSQYSNNIWNSIEHITYQYKGLHFTNYMGNYWSDYTGSDADGDGLGETPYSIGSDADNYPLMESFENYFAPTEVVVPATIDIHPDTLNLKSKGEWITCYIELPEDYSVEDIDIDSVALTKINDNFLDPPLYTVGPSGIGDCDEDGVAELMVKFDRSAVQGILEEGDEVDITVTGEVAGTPFEGSDTIRVIDKGKGK